MKLLNHTLSYLSIAFFVVIGVWATFFYFNLLDEIYDSIDDGLRNSKILIIQKAATDTTVLHKTDFMESNYAIHSISEQRALHFRDAYVDSVMYMVHEDDYEPVRILKTVFRGPDGNYYRLDVVSSMVEEDDLIEDLFYSILWLYLILLVSMLVINNFLLRRIWKPFYHIIDRLRNFSLESPQAQTEPDTTVTEFKMLNDSVSSLMERSVATYNSQKQFIENASHELQTPLAISINKLELLAEKDSLSDADLQEVSAVILSLERLTRLNKTLLLLSRIENRQFAEQEKINFHDLVDTVVSDLSDLSEYKSVRVSRVYNAPLTFAMNPELASMMISNIVKNAIVHNLEGGTVTVTVDAASISISNSGSSEPLDPNRVFKRFYKGATSSTSTGLGLAIVKSIADYYGMRIRYNFDGTHRFTVSLPEHTSS